MSLRVAHAQEGCNWRTAELSDFFQGSGLGAPLRQPAPAARAALQAAAAAAYSRVEDCSDERVVLAPAPARKKKLAVSMFCWRL